MILHLHRSLPTGPLISGLLSIDDNPFSATIENADFAFPKGCYRIRLSFSHKFQRHLPILDEVYGFRKDWLSSDNLPRPTHLRSTLRTGIRIHRGSLPEHSLGCILIPSEQKLNALCDGLARDQVAGVESFIFIDEPDTTAAVYDYATTHSLPEDTDTLIHSSDDD